MEKPLVSMLEIIARLAMVRISRRNLISQNHAGRCTPYVHCYISKELEAASHCRVFRSTNMMFQLQLRGCSYRVSLERKSCSCRKWDLTGIPCEHAYEVILSKKLEVDDFVFDWFKTDVWRKTYEEGLAPIRGARFWPTGNGPTIHVPPEPRQPGRKKKNKRKKGTYESPVKRSTSQSPRVMHCGICGQPGHNCRFHKKDFTQLPLVVSSSQPSQEEPSQGVLTLVVLVVMLTCFWIFFLVKHVTNLG